MMGLPASAPRTHPMRGGRKGRCGPPLGVGRIRLEGTGGRSAVHVVRCSTRGRLGKEIGEGGPTGSGREDPGAGGPSGRWPPDGRGEGAG